MPARFLTGDKPRALSVHLVIDVKLTSAEWLGLGEVIALGRCKRTVPVILSLVRRGLVTPLGPPPVSSSAALVSTEYGRLVWDARAPGASS